MITTRVSSKIFAQIYATYCQRREVDQTSDGQLGSEYEVVRDEIINEWNVVAGFGYYNDEQGTTGRNPINVDRSHDLEKAIEDLLAYVFEQDKPADLIWLTLMQVDDGKEEAP